MVCPNDFQPLCVNRNKNLLFFFCTHGWTGHKQCGAKWALCLIVDEVPALLENFNCAQAKKRWSLHGRKGIPYPYLS